MMKPIEIALRILAVICNRLLRALLELLTMFGEILNILTGDILRPVLGQMERFAPDLERHT